jgi:hypothetical protein
LVDNLKRYSHNISVVKTHFGALNNLVHHSKTNKKLMFAHKGIDLILSFVNSSKIADVVLLGLNILRASASLGIHYKLHYIYLYTQHLYICCLILLHWSNI